MQTETHGAQPVPSEAESATWQTALVGSAWPASLLIGLATLTLGLIVAFHPSGSLNVIAVLVGVLLIVSGIFHVVRAFGRGEDRRIWLGIAGLLLIVIGVVLLRHIHLTTAVLGLLIGVVWIVQGLAWLMSGMAGRAVTGTGWWIAFGLISLIAGIVVAASPVTSVTALAVLAGIWFAIMGVFEIIGAFMLRHVTGRAHQELADGRRESPAGA
jgi:uncharacterized membrane protein HdeD (DUF308 family)